MKDHLSTREAAQKLGIAYPQMALPILKAGKVSHVRVGTYYFWENRGVERLARVLAEEGEGVET